MPVRLAFGGPDLAPGALRDLLQAEVDASPPGSSIHWSTYYFRDRRLADALLRAADRGVDVHLCVEARPRRKDANRQVIEQLGAHGLRGLALHRPGRFVHGHLHAKIYIFSHSRTAWVGSYNPSGDEPYDEDVIAEIGDQDRGHNLLAGIDDPVVVRALQRHVESLCAGTSTLFDRLRPRFNRRVDHGSVHAYFYPRLSTRVVEARVWQLAAGDTLDAAISHLKPGSLSSAIKVASRRGVLVRLVVHDTERRVPQALVDALRRAGTEVTRYVHPDALPMHAKFIVLGSLQSRESWIGSHNFNPRSRWLNHEVLLRLDDAAIADALKQRFEQIRSAALGIANIN